MRHVPVLLAETIAALVPKSGETYVDCTAGLGGHAAAIAERIGPAGMIVLNDLDEGNLTHAAARIAAIPNAPRVLTHRGSFAALPHFLRAQGLRADLVLADLGFASPQVDDPSRGLSFMRDGPLDMRLDPSGPVTAAQLIASSSEDHLTSIIREFGEERHGKLVAQRIVRARAQAPIMTTAQLAAVIRSALAGKSSGGIDPATRTFQALRIAVNDELGHLAALLDELPGATTGPRAWLNPGARVAIISFHSLEDRPVKQAFAAMAKQGVALELEGSPITPGQAEERENPRSRSAKLRAITFR